MARCYNNITPSRFFCTNCGKEGIPISRPRAHQRELGHLKNLYCIYCKDTYNHVEIGNNRNYTYEDFKEDFEAGVFLDKRIYEEAK